ncbi:hypothetical protein JW796_00560 [Candidatus Dojkabacteria bacterium]|nr:hypothetical protein [Candidatus Dojkabacteria bacterium]
MKKELSKLVLFVPLILLGLWTVIFIIPYYNYSLRLVLILGHPFLLFFVLLSSLGYFLFAIIKKKLYLFVISVCTLLSLIAVWFFPASEVRQNVTQRVINGYYCSKAEISNRDVILGGITVSVSADREESLVFINESHCLMTVCAEELYYCNEERPIILD